MSTASPGAPASNPVREGLKRLSADSVVYGLGQAGGRAVQLLLVPILTRALAPDAFGILELVVAYSQTAVLVLVCGLDGALGRMFYDQPDREARIRMASTVLIFRLVTAALAMIVLVALAHPLASQFFGGDAYAKYLSIGATTLPFTLLVLFCNDLLRITFQPWKFITLNLVQTTVVLGLSLWLVVRMELGVVGALYGRLAGDALAALVGMVMVRHTVRPRFDAETLRRMLAYGAPLVPALFGFGLIASLDRYALQRTRTLEELAVYAVAAKFFTAVSMFATAFQFAYAPFAFARARAPEAPRLFARVFAGYAALGSLVALTVGVFAPEVLAVLVPATYAGAAIPALWLAFAGVLLGAYTVLSVGVALSLKSTLLIRSAGAGALVAGVGNAVLTPRFGPEGAAIATLLGYATSAIVTYVLSQQVHPLPYRGARLALLGVAALALGFAAQRLGPVTGIGIAVKLGAIALFVALCAALRIWTDRGAVAPAHG